MMRDPSEVIDLTGDEQATCTVTLQVRNRRVVDFFEDGGLRNPLRGMLITSVRSFQHTLKEIPCNIEIDESKARSLQIAKSLMPSYAYLTEDQLAALILFGMESPLQIYSVISKHA